MVDMKKQEEFVNNLKETVKNDLEIKNNLEKEFEKL